MTTPEPRAATRDADPPDLVDPKVTVGGTPTAPATPSKRRPRFMRPPDPPVRILFFSANTSDGGQLALDDEYREIDRRIAQARHRDAFQLIHKPAARRGDLQDALLKHRPHVVHFACHGSAQAELFLRSEGPESAPISEESLAELFEVLHDNLVLVVFNACFASMQASAIRPSAKVAIGMRSRVEDKAAIAFASALYGALADGRSVEEAFKLGRSALDERQRQLPELLPRTSIDARAVILVRPRRRLLPHVALAVASVALVVGLKVGGAAQDPVDHQPDAGYPPPVRGMVRFAATDIRPGVFDTARRPASCSALGEAEDCAELVHPEQVTPVHVAAFELDVMEVTNAEFASWLNATSQLWTTDPHGRINLRGTGVPLALAAEDCLGALVITEGSRVVASPDKARWPAVCVTWYGATEYCRGQHNKRLPLEVEWELAAKGAEGRPFPWGADLPRQDGVTFDLRDGGAQHPRDVGGSPQDVSPQGIHDLGGNVAEWIEDGRGASATRTFRGGSWGSRGPCHLLGSGCKREAEGKYHKDVGFRCASSVIDGT